MTRADARPSQGVLVTGMHRSGTSAVTRALHGLGLALPPAEDLMGSAESNPAGHFESWSLTSLNDQLLLALGGTWSGPPEPPPGWEAAPAVGPLVDRATEAFARVYGRSRWVWKDPRTSLTLPFWRRVLGHHPLMLVFRHPAEVARSLEARDRLEPEVGAALWSRYVRALLEAAAGLPTFVAAWDRLREDFGGSMDAAAAWLADAGALPAGAPAGRVRDLDEGIGSIRLSEAERREAPFVRPEDHALVDLLRSLEGPHVELPRLELPAEAEERTALLAARRAEELAALVRRASAAETEALRGHAERLEAELGDQARSREEIAAYARRLEEEVRRKADAEAEVRAYVRHLEDEIRRKEAHIDSLSRRTGP
ncbi:MAG TPA: hypothetical protein VHL78_13605 [Actinomycetota bacterium]|nr:hypothetical protein [Actinomycetota bacterium]